MSTDALIPPDLSLCQADVPNGNTFMTLGGRPGRERCNRVPVVIAVERKPGADGQTGSMSLCLRCLSVLSTQEPQAWAGLPIESPAQSHPDDHDAAWCGCVDCAQWRASLAPAVATARPSKVSAWDIAEARTLIGHSSACLRLLPTADCACDASETRARVARALATARLDGARAMLDKVRERTAVLRVTIGAVAEADTCPDVDMEDEIHDLRLTVDQIDALDPAAVVGSGS